MAVDCVSLTVCLHGRQDEDFLIRGSSSYALEGLAWSGNEFQFLVSVPLNRVEEFSIRADHFIGFRQITYRNIYKFILSEYLHFSYFRVFIEDVRQAIFNARTKIRGKRIEILKVMVEFRYQQAEDQEDIYSAGIMPIDFLFKTYGTRIVTHPKFHRIQEEIEMNLESLVGSGDVLETIGKYRAAGKALETISIYEEDNRRYISQRRQNFILLFLTSLLAVSALLEIIDRLGQTQAPAFG